RTSRSLFKQLAHRLIEVNPLDRIRQQRRHRQHLDIRQVLFGRQGDTVGDDDLLDGGVAEAFDGGAAQDAVGGAGVNLAGAVVLGHVGGAHDAAGGRDHVVEDDRHLAVERGADQVGRLRVGSAGATLVDDGDVAAQPLLIVQRPLDAAFVRAQDDEVLLWNLQAADVLGDHRRAVHVVDGDVEEAPDLGGVKVEGEHPIGAGDGEQVGDELGGDRHAPDVLAVLAGVTVIGQHGGDPRGAGAPQAVQNHQELHDVVIDRR